MYVLISSSILKIITRVQPLKAIEILEINKIIIHPSLLPLIKLQLIHFKYLLTLQQAVSYFPIYKIV